MAVALAWRIALRLAPPIGAGLVRLLKWSEGPGLSTATELWDRLTDPAESDEALTVALSESRGYASEVTTFAGDFEVRRVQLSWTVSSASLLDEDVRVCTWHLIKVAGAVPVSAWDGADFSAAQAAYLAWWGTAKGSFLNTTKLASIKFYRAGPGIVPPQPPVYTHEPTPIAGVVPPGFQLPPQCAVSVTEKTSIRKSWGRFYLPAYGNSNLSPEGRVPDALCTAIADAADTLYEALRVANLPVVVYRPALPARFSRDAVRVGAEAPDIAAREASALTVDSIQVDNLFDVIRSRRYDKPTLRVQRAVG